MLHLKREQRRRREGLEEESDRGRGRGEPERRGGGQEEEGGEVDNIFSLLFPLLGASIACVMPIHTGEAVKVTLAQSADSKDNLFWK